MDILVSSTISLGGGALIFALLAAVTWNWDAGLLQRTAQALSRELSRTDPAGEAEARAAALAFLRRTLGPDASFGRFVLRIALVSLASLAALTVIYFLSVPGLPAEFFTAWMSLKLLLRQLILNGFVSTFLVTWASWALWAAMIPQLAAAGPGRLALHIVCDILLKLVLLAALSAAIFALFARYAGSFGGSPAVAVSVVPETLASALAFRALSGAQVYAALLTGFPFFMLLALRLLAPRPWAGELWRRVERVLPISEKPFRFLGLVMAVFCAGSGLLAAQMLRTLRDASGL